MATRSVKATTSCEHCWLDPDCSTIQVAEHQLFGVNLCRMHWDLRRTVCVGGEVYLLGPWPLLVEIPGVSETLRKGSQELRTKSSVDSGYRPPTLASLHRQLITLSEKLASPVPPGHVDYIGKNRAASWANALAGELGVIVGQGML